VVHSITSGYNGSFCNARSVKVKKSGVTLRIGATERISAVVRGVKSGRKVLAHSGKLRYFSSDRNVATVSSNGKIKATGVGSCTICVMASDGVYASVKVKVVDGPTKVRFRKRSYSLKKGGKLKLAGQVRLTPSDMKTTYTWSSSDPAIATVSDKGAVKGLKKGTVTITVTAKNGRQAKTKVKVK